MLLKGTVVGFSNKVTKYRVFVNRCGGRVLNGE